MSATDSINRPLLNRDFSATFSVTSKASGTSTDLSTNEQSFLFSPSAAAAVAVLSQMGIDDREETNYLTVGSQTDFLLAGAPDVVKVECDGIDIEVPSLFGVVEQGVFRSGFPEPQHFTFIKKLNVRTVVNLLDRLPEEYKGFLERESIKYLHYAVKGNKRHCEEMDRSKVADAISHVMDVRNHPVLIHCRSGKHRTGALVGCIRMLQRWSLEEACDEYIYYCKHKQRYVDKQYIERFDPRSISALVPDAEFLPYWLKPDCTTYMSALEEAVQSGLLSIDDAEYGIPVSAVMRGPAEPGVPDEPAMKALQAVSVSVGLSPSPNPVPSRLNCTCSCPMNCPCCQSCVDSGSVLTGKGLVQSSPSTEVRSSIYSMNTSNPIQFPKDENSCVPSPDPNHASNARSPVLSAFQPSPSASVCQCLCSLSRTPYTPSPSLNLTPQHAFSRIQRSLTARDGSLISTFAQLRLGGQLGSYSSNNNTVNNPSSLFSSSGASNSGVGVSSPLLTSSAPASPNIDNLAWKSKSTNDLPILGTAGPLRAINTPPFYAVSNHTGLPSVQPIHPFSGKQCAADNGGEGGNGEVRGGTDSNSSSAVDLDSSRGSDDAQSESISGVSSRTSFSHQSHEVDTSVAPQLMKHSNSLRSTQLFDGLTESAVPPPLSVSFSSPDGMKESSQQNESNADLPSGIAKTQSDMLNAPDREGSPVHDLTCEQDINALSSPTPMAPMSQSLLVVPGAALESVGLPYRSRYIVAATDRVLAAVRSGQAVSSVLQQGWEAECNFDRTVNSASSLGSSILRSGYSNSRNLTSERDLEKEATGDLIEHLVPSNGATMKCKNEMNSRDSFSSDITLKNKDADRRTPPGYSLISGDYTPSLVAKSNMVSGGSGHDTSSSADTRNPSSQRHPDSDQEIINNIINSSTKSKKATILPDKSTGFSVFTHPSMTSNTSSASSFSSSKK